MYAHSATTRLEFAREQHRFVAEVRRIFSRHDIAVYFEALEQDAGVPNLGPHSEKLEDSGILMSVADKKGQDQEVAAVENNAAGRDA